MTYKTNILDFVNNLPTSNVKFAYKQSNQLYVRTSFKNYGNSHSYFHHFCDTRFKEGKPEGRSGPY